MTYVVTLSLSLCLSLSLSGHHMTSVMTLFLCLSLCLSLSLSGHHMTYVVTLSVPVSLSLSLSLCLSLCQVFQEMQLAVGTSRSILMSPNSHYALQSNKSVFDVSSTL